MQVFFFAVGFEKNEKSLKTNAFKDFFIFVLSIPVKLSLLKLSLQNYQTGVIINP